MAKFLPTAGSLSGKLGGVVYSRNRNGSYVRLKVSPVNPQSNAQNSIRAALGSGAVAYSGTLTAAQRTGWGNYGLTVIKTDTFGLAYTLTGIQAFLRTWAFRQFWALSVKLTAPDVTGIPETPNLGGNEGAAVAKADGSTTDPNTVVLDADLIVGFPEASNNWQLEVWLSRPQSPGTVFFNGPWRSKQLILGNSTTPPNLVAIPVGDILLAGQTMFCRIRQMDPKGRLSAVNQIRLGAILIT